MYLAGPVTIVRSAQLAGVGVVLGYVLLVQLAANRADYDVWAALLFIPVLLLISVPLIERAGRTEPGRWLLRLLVAAFVLKVLATVARYLMAFVMYDGVSDASGYHDEGARLAAGFRSGDLSPDLDRDFVGTGFIQVLTGVLYAVAGPSIYSAYAFFAWLGFWGLFFFYAAFRTAVPDGNRRRYGMLVLLLPSMLFWPSGLGKEAWMTLCLGLCALGAARLLAEQRHWLLPLAVGLAGTGVVRPHITAALFAGIAAAAVLRRSQRPATMLTPLTRTAGIVAIVLAGLAIVRWAAGYLGIESLTAENVDATIAETRENTGQGGSEFDAQQVNSPGMMPWATISVLFRPFLFEVDSAQVLLAAMEGTVLLVLVALSARRLPWLIGHLRAYPYLILCVVYTLLFVYAFSSFANFGILTRQRVQVLPFVLVLLALPRPVRSRGDSVTTRHLQEVPR